MYFRSVNHSCIFLPVPSPPPKKKHVVIYGFYCTWKLMGFFQLFNCVVFVFPIYCVPSSTRESPSTRHSMTSKWICISEVCIYVYLCIFIYFYWWINRWWYVCARVRRIRKWNKAILSIVPVNGSVCMYLFWINYYLLIIFSQISLKQKIEHLNENCSFKVFLSFWKR